MHIVANGWFAGQLTTGSGQYLHYLLQYLPRIAPGHRYSLVVPSESSQSELASHHGWQSHTAHTPFDGRQENLAKVWFEQVAFPRACRQLRGDVAFVPYWGSPRRCPCPVVVTVHDLIPLLLADYRGGQLQRGYTSLVAATAKRADYVVTDSQASKGDIVARLGISQPRIHAIHLAADSRFQPIADPAELDRVRRIYQLPDSYFLYLGGFDVRKNIPRLVRAYWRFLSRHDSEIGPPKLVIAGKLPSSDSGFFPDPRHAVEALDIQEMVQFTGWVEEKDKPALYTQADAFLFPSLYEGFGLPVAEAAACGTPVITSNRSSLPEITPAATLVDPEDEQAIADAMAHVLTSEQPVQVQDRRTWQEVAEETLAVLEATQS